MSTVPRRTIDTHGAAAHTTAAATATPTNNPMTPPASPDRTECSVPTFQRPVSCSRYDGARHISRGWRQVTHPERTYSPIRCSPKVTLQGGTMTNVGIRLLGAVAVERDGVAETRRSRNHGAILGMLALHAGEAVDGDLLIDEAWGEDLPKNPRGALQIARRGCGPGWGSGPSRGSPRPAGSTPCTWPATPSTSCVSTASPATPAAAATSRPTRRPTTPGAARRSPGSTPTGSPRPAAAPSSAVAP